MAIGANNRRGRVFRKRTVAKPRKSRRVFFQGRNTINSGNINGLVPVIAINRTAETIQRPVILKNKGGFKNISSKSKDDIIKYSERNKFFASWEEEDSNEFYEKYKSKR